MSTADVELRIRQVQWYPDSSNERDNFRVFFLSNARIPRVLVERPASALSLRVSVPSLDLYHGHDNSYKTWPSTKLKHATGKSKPKLVSGPILKVRDQSITKRRRFQDCNLYEVRMENKLNGQGLPLHRTKPCEENYIFKMMAFL